MDNQTKERIIEAVRKDREKYNTDADHARKFGLDTSRYSTVFNSGKYDKMLSDDHWVSIAMDLRLRLKNSSELVVAHTPTFDYITAQMRKCQEDAMSLMFCDKCDIGKTIAAEEYMRNNKNVVYVDCSQYKKPKSLVKTIARLFGVDTKGTLEVVEQRLKFHLNNVINNPLIILDEYGDINKECYMEVKSIWNGSKGSCAWYALGADGLRAKFEKGIENDVVGYAELFSRFGSRYQNITQSKDWIGRQEEFNQTQISIVAKANGFKNIQQALVDSQGSLRRLSYIAARTI